MRGSIFVVPGERRDHWEQIYATRPSDTLSWYQPSPAPSLEMLEAAGVVSSDALVDVGGGTSLLVDELLARGYDDLSVLDVSEAALDQAKGRLGERSGAIHWIRQDITSWHPERRYRVWHDRAVLHFLVTPDEQQAYVACLREAILPGGRVVIATFAPDGPEQCSGLPVLRNDPNGIASLLGPTFELLATTRQVHRTPAGGEQAFSWAAFSALPDEERPRRASPHDGTLRYD